MKKLSVIFVLMLWFHYPIFCQTVLFDRTFSAPQSSYCHRPNYGFSGIDLAFPSDSSILVLTRCNLGGDSCTSTADNEVVLLLKLNSAGDTIWTRIIMNSINDPNFATYLEGHAITSTFDNNFIIAGETEAIYPLVYAFLTKIDTDGYPLWRKDYHTNVLSRFRDVIETDDFGYLAGGAATGSSGSNSEMYVVKTDSSGNELWYQTYGGGYGDCYSLINNHNSTYTLIGEIEQPYNYKFIMMHINASNGNEISRYYFGDSTKSERCFRGIKTSDNKYVMIGNASYWRNQNLCALKVDYNGNVDWHNSYGDSLHAYWPMDVLETCDSGLIITGGVDICRSTSGQLDCDTTKAFLTKLDKNGIKQWEKIWEVSASSRSAFIFRMKEYYNRTYMAVGDNSSGCYVIHFDSLYICNATNINNILDSKNEINIYPNPSDGNIYLSFSGIGKHGYIEIIDLLGQVIYKDIFNLTEEKKIQFNNASKGIYFVRVHSEEQLYCKRIIIE